MVTGTSGRRGFLRNVALAVGALLVGVGRMRAATWTHRKRPRETLICHPHRGVFP